MAIYKVFLTGVEPQDAVVRVEAHVVHANDEWILLTDADIDAPTVAAFPREHVVSIVREDAVGPARGATDPSRSGALAPGQASPPAGPIGHPWQRPSP